MMIIIIRIVRIYLLRVVCGGNLSSQFFFTDFVAAALIYRFSNERKRKPEFLLNM